MSTVEDGYQVASDGGKPSIALVAYDSLGDGLVYLMMAENLRLNGFDVTYYGGRITSLASWFPQLSIKPYPIPHDIEFSFQGFDLVLYSPPSFVRRASTGAELRRLAERYVVICLGRQFSESWRVDHRQRIVGQLSPDKSRRLQHLASCSGVIRRKRFAKETVVQTTLAYMQGTMGLEHVTAEVQRHAPCGLHHRKYRDRVVLCPDSAEPVRKDWTPSRVVDLAARLKAAGLDPKIVASPENVSKWQSLSSGVCESPALLSVEALASYLYESAVAVSSDSGSGHLASFLGIPTVTIYRRMNPAFAWRPGWAPGVVVCPLLTLDIFKRHMWRPFIPALKIVRAVDGLLDS